ncbi:beta-galactosidase/beta-glucuronidase [Flammeovirgaceae bacterium 311]|nr:beta-galactosidase/beta-glucuronidase [Flammeovirgaceae bacterium 311]
MDPVLTKKQQHPTDLKKQNAVSLHVDLKQLGVGGDNSWSALPYDQLPAPRRSVHLLLHHPVCQ